MQMCYGTVELIDNFPQEIRKVQVIGTKSDGEGRWERVEEDGKFPQKGTALLWDQEGLQQKTQPAPKGKDEYVPVSTVFFVMACYSISFTTAL